MKEQYNLSKMKARKNPYASKLKKPDHTIPKKKKNHLSPSLRAPSSFGGEAIQKPQGKA
ncbi:MAG: hypothetical protein ACOY2B_11305 [Pseudomonadota bacterium]